MSFSVMEGRLEVSFSVMEGRLDVSFSVMEGRLKVSFSVMEGRLDVSFSGWKTGDRIVLCNNNNITYYLICLD